MVVADQVNALAGARDGIPTRKLVLPRVLAGTVMCAGADVVATSSGYPRRLDGAPSPRCSVGRACTGTSVTEALYPQDAWMGLLKPFVSWLSSS
jgi:hypothetical protein